VTTSRRTGTGPGAQDQPSPGAAGREAPTAGIPTLADPLSFALPDAGRTSFLRACLLEGEKGRQAWRDWLAGVGDPFAFIRQESQGAKGLLPLLFKSLARNEVVLEQSLQTTLKTAYVNEEVRTESYSRIVKDVLSAFARHRLDLMVVNGADLAFTVYDHPALRHTDGFDIILADDDPRQAIELLETLGCARPEPAATGDWRRVDCRHRSGLVITLNRDIFNLPTAVLSTEMWDRSRIANVAGVPVRVLSPSDGLLRTCAGVYYGRGPASLRWVCDACMLVARSPGLDWQALLDLASGRGMSLPLALTLGYLKDHLDVSIPDEVLTGVVEAASRTNMVGQEVAFGVARGSPGGGFKRMLRSTDDWRTRGALLRWMFFPSPAYLRWKGEPVQGLRLPLYHLYRPLKHFTRRRGSRHA